MGKYDDEHDEAIQSAVEEFFAAVCEGESILRSWTAVAVGTSFDEEGEPYDRIVRFGYGPATEQLGISMHHTNLLDRELRAE